MSPSREIVIVQSAWPPYRQSFLDEFRRRGGMNLTIVSGDVQFAAGVAEDIEFPESRLHKANNRFVLRRNVLWQSSVMQHILRPDVAILELNPRIVNTWLGLILRRVLRRPTILWGHAWPRHGPEQWTDQIRQVQRRLANVLLVYTEKDARDLMQKVHGAPVFAAPNALYASEAIGSRKSDALTDIVFSGRLVPEKKPQLLLDAFIEARLDTHDPLSGRATLSYVGEGPLAGPLQRRAAAAGVESRVRFFGPVWQPWRLQPIYDSAFVAVSSGYAGLNVVQASSFGTRIVVADSEPHAPEVAYLEEGRNGTWFRSDSTEDLARVLVSEWRQRADARSSAKEIVEWSRANCSVEAMVEGFLSAIDYAASEHT